MSDISLNSESQLSKFQVLGMAVVAGICVSNIYYAQPILHQIAETFKVSESKMGIMVGLGQVGYGAGLLTLVPLGDKVNRIILYSCRNRNCFQLLFHLFIQFIAWFDCRCSAGYFANGRRIIGQ